MRTSFTSFAFLIPCLAMPLLSRVFVSKRKHLSACGKQTTQEAALDIQLNESQGLP